MVVNIRVGFGCGLGQFDDAVRAEAEADDDGRQGVVSALDGQAELDDLGIPGHR